MSVHTYRHRVTGLVAEMDDSLASVFPDVLELVQDGTKPLAYVPISQDDIDALRDEAVTEDAALTDFIQTPPPKEK